MGSHLPTMVRVLPRPGFVDGRGLEFPGLTTELNRVLARGHRVVVCELSGMAMSGSDVGALFAPVGGLLAAWPGSVVVVCSTDRGVRQELDALPAVYRLVVCARLEEGVTLAYARLRLPDHAELSLGAALTAPRRAREFVTRTMLDWRLSVLIAPACLVVSELVTNVVLYAGTPAAVSLSRLDGVVLVTVGDRGRAASGLWPSSVVEKWRAGHRSRLVQAFTLGSGEFAVLGEGKTVWAVLGGAPDVLPGVTRQIHGSESRRSAVVG